MNDLSVLNLNEPLDIAADSGKGMLKTCYKNTQGNLVCATRNAIINSGISEGGETFFINGKVFNQDGNKKLAADDNTSKDNIKHFILLQRGLFDIYQETRKRDFIVYYTVTIDNYFDLVQRKLVEKNFMKYMGRFEIKIGNSKVELSVRDVIIRPENLSSICKAKTLNENSSTYLIDIGTLNNTVARIDKKRISTNIDDYFIDLKGYQYIIKDIAKFYNSKVNSREKWVDEYKIDIYINSLRGRDASLEKYIELYFREKYMPYIKQELIEMKFNPLFDNIIFTGGGSEIFSDFIKPCFKDDVEIIENSIYANVIGAYEDGVKKRLQQMEVR